MTSYHIGMREHLRDFIAVKDELIERIQRGLPLDARNSRAKRSG